METVLRRHRRTVACALIVCGAVLALGVPYLVEFSDSRIARTRQRETDAWVGRYDSTFERSPSPTRIPGTRGSAKGRTTAPAGRTAVVAPGAEGYLLIIPRIGVRTVVRLLETDVFSGRNTPALRRYGLGQVPYTRLLRNVSPGADGTAAIAGHRTTSGAPFRHIDRLRPGDVILIRKRGVEQRWVVVGSATVPPSAVGVIKSRRGLKRLAILACSPPFSARERLVVTARLAAVAMSSTRSRLQPELWVTPNTEGG
jgi:sortase A